VFEAGSEKKSYYEVLLPSTKEWNFQFQQVKWLENLTKVIQKYTNIYDTFFVTKNTRLLFRSQSRRSILPRSQLPAKALLLPSLVQRQGKAAHRRHHDDRRQALAGAVLSITGMFSLLSFGLFSVAKTIS